MHCCSCADGVLFSFLAFNECVFSFPTELLPAFLKEGTIFGGLKKQTDKQNMKREASSGNQPPHKEASAL